MLGVLVNALAIIVCSLVGLLIKKLINEKVENTVMQALGVCVVIIGVMDAIKPVEGTVGILVVIISMAIGAIIGSLLNIEKGFENLGIAFEKGFYKLMKKGKSDKGNFAEGFVQATLIFCIGAMVVYGSLQAGLGDNKTLFVKAVLDGVVALLLTVKYGIGVLFSFIPVLLIQGAVAGLSGVIGDYLLAQPLFMQELSAIGGVFVVMIGINLLGIKKIHVANMLPALLGACYYLF